MSKNITERNNKCKTTRCIWGGRRLSLTHYEENNREYEEIPKNRSFPAVIFVVLKLPCLDVETDAKNPRQAGTVAKNPRGTDAKNPPQLAPLQKTPVTVWNVPTVAKNPYYRRKKPQPPYYIGQADEAKVRHKERERETESEGKYLYHLERIDGTTPISVGLSFRPLQITTFWELCHLLWYCFISDMSLCWSPLIWSNCCRIE